MIQTRIISRIVAWIGDFFEAAPGSLKNHLNAQELYRIIGTALTTGGGVFAVLQGILAAAGVVFPAPIDAAFATLVLTVILEAHRRLGQGEPPPRPFRRSRTGGA